ncbi:hypothetical protein AaE_008270 [Aphanomyces astaci]|uniref:Uncharacterized protein n=1 Tax=Aphanomyces astaci TaxID=112090 RepID=A0A6A5A0G7_APHAT|nr:hypothetical protein AaE_008270 [Aphanomyces astaci]
MWLLLSLSRSSSSSKLAAAIAAAMEASSSSGSTTTLMLLLLLLSLRGVGAYFGEGVHPVKVERGIAGILSNVSWCCGGGGGVGLPSWLSSKIAVSNAHIHCSSPRAVGVANCTHWFDVGRKSSNVCTTGAADSQSLTSRTMSCSDSTISPKRIRSDGLRTATADDPQATIYIYMVERAVCRTLLEKYLLDEILVSIPSMTTSSSENCMGESRLLGTSRLNSRAMDDLCRVWYIRRDDVPTLSAWHDAWLYLLLRLADDLPDTLVMARLA